MTAMRLTILAMAVLLPVVAAAQTTTPGVAVDVEVYNPADGTNMFCVDPGETFWAHVYVRPGSDATSCSQVCGTVPGGPANIATAAIDMAFDPAVVGFLAAETNPDSGFAAVDGLIQEQNAASGRVGWALAGDWAPDATPGSGLADPCSMMMLDGPGWVYRVQFEPVGYGTTSLSLRQQPDFELSFADMCGSSFNVGGGGIDEVVAAQVVYPCTTLLFIDGFESGDTSAWSAAVIEP